MRWALVLAFIALSFSGCTRVGQLAESQICSDPEAVTRLQAQDTLVVRPNRSYVLGVGEHTPAWGRIVIQLCEDMPLAISADVRIGVGPKSFLYADWFLENATPSLAGGLAHRWNPMLFTGSCDLPRPGPMALVGLASRAEAPDAVPAGRYVLLLMGASPYGKIWIQTGAPEDTREITWSLVTHPELGVHAPMPFGSATTLQSSPPRTLVSDWDAWVKPTVPSIQRFALWTKWPAQPAAGSYDDNATFRIGDGRQEFSARSWFACDARSIQGYQALHEAYNLDAQPVQFFRRYQETGTPTLGAERGVAILTLPLEAIRAAAKD